MTFVPQTPPYSHQKEALDLMRFRKSFALFLEMGTGKTKVILDEFCADCSKAPTDLLVIAPAGSYANWLEELEAHLDPRLMEDLLVALWRTGNAASRKVVASLASRVNADASRVLIVNVEALSSAKTGARQICSEFLRAGKATLVVDESTKIKSPTADRTRAIWALAGLAKKRRILTGLPNPNSPLDLFSQFYFLDPNILGHRNFPLFRARYAKVEMMDFGGRWLAPIIKGYQNVEELADKIKPWSFRKTKDECLDLPAKIYMPPRAVPMAEEQGRVYNDLKKRATVELEGGENVTAAMVMTRLQRLHQILCGHVVDEKGKQIDLGHNPRDDELVELLSQHSGKAIVWASYIFNVTKLPRLIEKELGIGSVARFYGGNPTEREEEARRWKTDPSCRVLLATQGAGGLGNTWVEADLVVYYSNTFNLEHRLQSEDRAHRSGQTKSVTYVDLMVPGTVDEKVIKALREKIDLASVVTGDAWREWII